MASTGARLPSLRLAIQRGRRSHARSPLPLGTAGRQSLELSYSQLLRLQELRPGRRDYVLSFHTHITFALANIVLLLLALPFAVNFERGSRIERIIMAVLLTRFISRGVLLGAVKG